MKQDNRGATAIEYGLIAALISVAAIGMLSQCTAERPADCPPAEQQSDGTFVIPAGGCASIPAEETNTLVDRDLNGPDQ